jgi:S1-C subfamily serine protease
MNKLKFAAILAAGAALAMSPAHAAAQSGPPIQLRPHPEGAEVIVLVPDGPAAGLGLKIGDIVLEVGGKAISPQVLQEYMSSKAEGDEVRFRVKREGAVVEVIGRAPPRPGGASGPAAQPQG